MSEHGSPPSAAPHFNQAAGVSHDSAAPSTAPAVDHGSTPSPGHTPSNSPSPSPAPATPAFNQAAQSQQHTHAPATQASTAQKVAQQLKAMQGVKAVQPAPKQSLEMPGPDGNKVRQSVQQDKMNSLQQTMKAYNERQKQKAQVKHDFNQAGHENRHSR